VLTVAVLLTLMASRASGPGAGAIHPKTGAHPTATPRPAATIRPTYGAVMAPASQQVHTRLKFHLRSGILFNVWTGQILWAHDPGQRLPIASLTKLMTALVVLERARPSDRVLISWQAVHFSGSGVGLLPLHKHVPVLSLLYGLLLPSGNDAAIALAQHVAGSERHFVDLMNARAQQMQLGCSHFASASGLVDRGNYSCTTDLAVLAHAVLDQPLLAHIVAARYAILRFPIKGGHLFLWNNNPLLIMRYPGTDGVKTGYTNASGPCLVAAARRGHAWLGVVLLHSVNPAGQAIKLLNLGFAKVAAH
jgi:D-alanyl-D-alanine carboxypeptidase